eukprot:g4.t1
MRVCKATDVQVNAFRLHRLASPKDVRKVNFKKRKQPKVHFRMPPTSKSENKVIGEYLMSEESKNVMKHLETWTCDRKTLNITDEIIGLIGSNYNAMLADFGDSIEEENSRVFDNPVGSPFYVSPEMILQEPVSAKSDVFSFGVVMYVCVVYYYCRAIFDKNYCLSKSLPVYSYDYADERNKAGKIKLHPTIISFLFKDDDMECKRPDNVESLLKSNSATNFTLELAQLMHTAAWRPKLPEGVRHNWSAIVELIEGCWSRDPGDRPSADEVFKTLKTCLQNRVGNEDDYLGMKTWPLRKFVYERGLEMIQSRRKIQYDGVPDKFGVGKFYINEKFNVKGVRSGFMGALHESDADYDSKTWFNNWVFENNLDLDTFVTGTIDGWMRYESPSQNFGKYVPFLKTRVFKTITFVHKTNSGVFLDIRIPVGYIPKGSPAGKVLYETIGHLLHDSSRRSRKDVIAEQILCRVVGGRENGTGPALLMRMIDLKGFFGMFVAIMPGLLKRAFSEHLRFLAGNCQPLTGKNKNDARKNGFKTLYQVFEKSDTGLTRTTSSTVTREVSPVMELLEEKEKLNLIKKVMSYDSGRDINVLKKNVHHSLSFKVRGNPKEKKTLAKSFIK